MSIFDWFRGKSGQPVATFADDAPSTERERNGFLTDGVPLADQVRATFGDIAAKLRSAFLDTNMQLPAGFTFDSSDGNGTGQLKQAYQFAQSNLPDELLMFFARQSFIGHQVAAMLAQHWLIDKACSMPGRDAIRNGYEFVSADGDKLDPERVKLHKRYARLFKLDANMKEFVHMGRVFGVRVMLFEVNSPDAQYYEKPFNPDGVGPNEYKGMTQIDPYWITPILDADASSNPASRHFYEPTWWLINGKKYHRSHLCIFRNSPPPDIYKPSYLYGGVPVPQQIVEKVYNAERTANEGPLLVLTKRTTVYYTDAAKALSNWETFVGNLQRWISLRDNQAVKVADKQDELIDQKDTSLADLDKVTMVQFQLVSAAAKVPATKLLETTPIGFNSTGDYEESSYHEHLRSIQTHDLQAVVERHCLLVERSYITPKLGDTVDITASWLPLDEPTAAEWADINLKRAQTDQALVEVGAIDQYDVRQRIAHDKDSGYVGIESSTGGATD